MAEQSRRKDALERCLDLGQPAAVVARELGVAGSTLRGWLRLGRLERDLAKLHHQHAELRQRQELIVAELQQAAAELAELKRLLDPEGDRAPG
ncbi:MAG: hypothetical protein AAFX65_13745 [Cyanobacteria bacterium J06638_7]